MGKMENLEIYESVRAVPKEAQKEIKGGRLNGMTDINPMWRIKKLTEEFGPCGIGWKYEVVNKWLETAMAKDEITANVEIKLYYKWKGEWSEPVPGIGGSMLVAAEKKGLYVNDECYKMALTDAISVACKSLGMGADIYWQKDNTKYNDQKRENVHNENCPVVPLASREQKERFMAACQMYQLDYKDIAKRTGAVSMAQMTYAQYESAMKIVDEMRNA